MGFDHRDVKSNVDRFTSVVSNWTAISYVNDATSRRSYHAPPNDQQWNLINEWFSSDVNMTDSITQEECEFAYPNAIQHTLGVRYGKYHSGDDVTIPALLTNQPCQHLRPDSPGPLEKYGLWGKPSAVRQGNDVVWEWAENDFVNMDFCNIQSFIEITIEKYSPSPMMFCFASLYKRPATILRHKKRNTLLLNNTSPAIVLIPVLDIKSHVFILHTCEYSRARACSDDNHRCTHEVFDQSFGWKPQYEKRIRNKISRSFKTFTIALLNC